MFLKTHGCIFRIAQCLIDVRGLRRHMHTVWFACHEHFEDLLEEFSIKFWLYFLN